MLRFLTICSLLSALSYSYLLGQQSDLYFEHLDHVEKRGAINMLPYSEFGSYVWTGNELLDISRDSVQSIYKLAHGTGGSIFFSTIDNDTTCLISNIFSTDVLLPTFVELKKSGNNFTETVTEFGPGIRSAIPYQNNGYIIGSFQSLYYMDQQLNFQLITDTLMNSVEVIRNTNDEIFILNSQHNSNEIAIYGLEDFELIPLYESTGSPKEFVVSNDSIAYILNESKIDAVDLKTGSMTSTINLNPAFGLDVTFTTNESMDQLYVFSKSNQSYINRYNLNGESSLLFTEPSPNYGIRKIAIKNSMIHSIGNRGLAGHYKVQQDLLVNPTNRRDLDLKNLEVFYLGMDTVINILPLNPPDTIITIYDLYSYNIEVENIGGNDINSYTSFSSPIKPFYPFQPFINAVICINYNNPLSIGETQIQDFQFRTSITLDSLRIDITGVDNMPDADYSNNFIIDKSFDIVNTTNTLSNQTNINIYPNPALNKINFQSDEEIYSIQIYNTNGHLKYLKNSTEPIYQANISQLPSNIYFIHFSNKKGRSLGVEKIVKN